MAKARAALAPILIVFTPLIAGLAILSPTAGVCAALGCTAATLSAVAIQLWRRVPARRSDFQKTNGSPNLTATLGQLLVTSCLSGAVAVGAGGLPWLAIPLLLIGAAVLGALKPATSKTHLPRS
jgi:ABC-2 type transport system permease protein